MDEPDYAYSYHDSLVQRFRFYLFRETAVRWHVRHPALTLLFPLVAPVLAVLTIGCLLWACGTAVARLVVDAVHLITREAWARVTELFS